MNNYFFRCTTSKNKFGLLRFELEIKKTKAHNYTKLLTKYCFSGFENDI